MAGLKIYCDAELDDDAMKLLRNGIAPHQLILPAAGGVSVLSSSPADDGLAIADIAFGQPDTESVLKASRLRWLQVTSAGFTRYDTPAFRAGAAARGLVVTNSSAVFQEPCAEHILAFMMAQARKLPFGLQARFDSDAAEWGQLRNASGCLLYQSAVILGFGRIAVRLIELLAPFKMKITAMRRQPRGDEGVPTVTPDNLAEALSKADHVINILPANADSHRFISAALLAQVKSGAIFYNIGRGTTVDQEALAESLHSGRLAAAWLDVTDPEPLPEGHPLLAAPNCFITPHTAGGHYREHDDLVRHFLENLRRFDHGLPLGDRIM